jgi:hypothetical protein
MGFAKFRAGFVGDASNEWSVTSSDNFLKQNEATHFVVRYSPHSPGVSNTSLVVEAEVSWKGYTVCQCQVPDSICVSIALKLPQDFKMTWKVVGSTGDHEF